MPVCVCVGGWVCMCEQGMWSEGGSLDDPDKFSVKDKEHARSFFGEDWYDLMTSARDWY